MDSSNGNASSSSGSIVEDTAPPERSSSNSAPPALQLASESLFAFRVEYAKIFSDIRAHEDYIQYYESNKEKKFLPAPLDPNPFVWDIANEDERNLHAFRQATPMDSSMAEAQDAFQQLNLRVSKGVDIPSANNSGIWNPVPRPARRGVSLTNVLTREDSKESLGKFNDINYSSSPSAQTALNTAHFILDDSGFTPPQPSGFPPVPHNNGNNFPTPDTNVKSEARSEVQGAPYANGTTSPTRQSPPNQSNQDEDDQQNATSPRSNVICRYYASGYCSRGDKCFYSHDVDAQDIVKPEPKAKATKGSKTNSRGKGAQPEPTTPSNGHTPSKEPPASAVSPRSQEPYTNFEQLIGKIYTVSKDQQGCRFLQKKLEEQQPEVVEIIFKEVFEHITELMTDPFGNYLCQKLVEHCTDHQRFLIVQRVAPDLVFISKNMHGTRAVQKLIECLSSPAQIDLVKRVLSNSVVELIQDLNGNHVIQRCLNRLSSEDNQFIYDAVTSGNNCVEVATHRHGCCVLQRCIDHASNRQKVQLIREITKNALVLVQDAYGNYVVQYVLELPFPDLVDSLARAFQGNLRHLATQKFSSNVVEKCLSAAGQEARTALVKELLSEKNHFAYLLQDPFANYVIQTALSVSEAQQHYELVEAIRPHLVQLRNTPYGKRIQSRIAKEANERSKR